MRSVGSEKKAAAACKSGAANGVAHGAANGVPHGAAHGTAHGLANGLDGERGGGYIGNGGSGAARQEAAAHHGDQLAVLEVLAHETARLEGLRERLGQGEKPHVAPPQRGVSFESDRYDRYGRCGSSKRGDGAAAVGSACDG